MAEINLPDDAIKKLISEAYGKVWSVKKKVDNYNNGRKFVPEYTNAPRTFGVKTAGEKMKQILLKHIREDTVSGERHGLADFPTSGIIVQYPRNSIARSTLPEGQEIIISFDEASVHRDSLYSDKYPNGVSNIVKLFVHGYTAKKRVYGVWHEKETASLLHRPPANDRSFYPNGNFIENAINEFNETFKGYAIAHIIDDDLI